MTSRRLRGFVALSALALGASACFGNVSLGGPGDASDDAGPTATQTLHDGGPAQTQTQTMTSDDADAGTDSGPPVKTTTSSSEAGTDSSPGTTTGTASTVFIDSTNGFHDGAVATDGTTLFWVQESLTEGGEDQLVTCPATGCPSSGPSVFWTQANWGDGTGELALVDGRIYFQTQMNGPVVSCPTSGCGSAPTQFVSVTNTQAFGAALVSDGTNLYWHDNDAIYACALGVSCASPSKLATLPSGDYVSELFADGTSVFWADSTAATMSSVPVAGGAASILCSVTGKTIDTIAVLGGYAYSTVAAGDSGNGSAIYRCPVTGGAATVYSSDSGAFNVATDGTNLYWLSYHDAGTLMRTCAPGETCASPTTLFDVLYTLSFIVDGDALYSVSGKIRRTTL